MKSIVKQIWEQKVKELTSEVYKDLEFLKKFGPGRNADETVKKAFYATLDKIAELPDDWEKEFLVKKLVMGQYIPEFSSPEVTSLFWQINALVKDLKRH